MNCEHCGATVPDDIPCCLRCAEEHQAKARAVFMALRPLTHSELREEREAQYEDHVADARRNER